MTRYEEKIYCTLSIPILDAFLNFENSSSIEQIKIVRVYLSKSSGRCPMSTVVELNHIES